MLFTKVILFVLLPFLHAIPRAFSALRFIALVSALLKKSHLLTKFYVIDMSNTLDQALLAALQQLYSKSPEVGTAVETAATEVDRPRHGISWSCSRERLWPYACPSGPNVVYLL
jgi:hypothetical protein